MRRLNGTTVLFLALAGLWGVAQLVLAFFVHVAVRGHGTTSGWVVPPAKTYMEAFGTSEVVLTLAIFGLVGLVAWVLHRRAARGEAGAGRVAWGVSLVTAALGAVGFVYLFGVGVCLLVACAGVSRRAPDRRGRDTPLTTGAAAG